MYDEVLCFMRNGSPAWTENHEPRPFHIFFLFHYWMVMESYDCNLWAALHFGDSEISILWPCGLSPTTGNGLRSAPPLPSSCDQIPQRKRCKSTEIGFSRRLWELHCCNRAYRKIIRIQRNVSSITNSMSSINMTAYAAEKLTN